MISISSFPIAGGPTEPDAVVRLRRRQHVLLNPSEDAQRSLLELTKQVRFARLLPPLLASALPQGHQAEQCERVRCDKLPPFLRSPPVISRRTLGRLPPNAISLLA